MKKFIALFIVAILAVCCVCTLCACQSADYTIDVLKFGNIPALNDAQDGFVDTLNAWAEKNGKTVAFNLHDASMQQSNVSAIAKDALANDPDYIFAIATPCAVTVAGLTNTCPIFYTAVTDPADSTANLTGHNNVFGTSDMQPIAKQIKLATLLTTDESIKIAFVYSTNETNSRTQVNIAKQACDQLGISYEDAAITDVQNLKSTVESISEDVDFIYIPTDNTVSEAMATVKTANKRNIPIIVGEEGMLANGGWVTLSVNYYNLGVQTANMLIEKLEKGSIGGGNHQQFAGEPAFVITQEAQTALGLTDQQIEQIKTKLGE